MGDVRYNISDKYLSDFLSKVPDRLERAKIKMTFWFSASLSFFLLVYMPVLVSISPVLAVIAGGIILVLLGNIYLLKKRESYKFSAKVVLTILLVTDLIFMSLVIPENLAGYLLCTIVLIALGTFILGKNWTIIFTVITIVGIAVTSWLKWQGYASGELLPDWAFGKDISSISPYTPIKLGSILVLLAYVLIEFFTISDDTQNELNETLKEQLKLNAELKRKETKYKRLIESVGDSVYEINGKGEFTYVNSTFKKMTGYGEEVILGENHLSIVAPYFREELNKFYLEQIEKRTTVFNHHFPIITRDGTEKWIGQTLSIFYDASGKVITSFCIGRDVTEYRKTRDKLNEAKIKAEEASMLKARFLSSMSHEIRTPINAIIGNIHLMQEEYLEEKYSERLNVLKFSADNLMALISNILDFNKLEVDKLELKKDVFNLSNSMTYIKMGLDKLVFEKGISLSLKIDKKLPHLLFGDSLRLTQVLDNLTHNAVKFTKSGGVIVEALEHLRTNEIVQIYFSVTDTGIGIAKEDKRTIFEEFTQANNEAIREGAGLGLAISEKLAKLMGSEIQLESTPGEGSKFWFIVEFDIPKENIEINKNQEIPCKGKKAQPDSLKGLKVLLVEDNIINQKVTASFLKKWGAEYEIANNGLEAVNKVEKKKFDMILMDLQMPIMNGVEATRKIRAMGGHPAQVPIIALTASAVLEVKEYAMKAGLTDFLTKPFIPVCLNQVMLNYADQKVLNDAKKMSGV